MKAARELGSERRETVRSISDVSETILRGCLFSTRGPKDLYLQCSNYYASSKRWVAVYDYE